MIAPLAAALLAASLAARAPAPVRAEAARSAPTTSSRRADEEARVRLVAAARKQVGRPFRGDCSAFVRHVFAKARVPLPRATKARSGTEAVAKALTPVSRPRPGDVAWFHRTHDRDRPGKGRNLFTHLAIVEKVRGSRVTLIHRGSAGVQRLELHLARRGDPAVNDVLRRRKPNDPPGRKVLAGELLGGFASPLSKAPAVAARTPPKPGVGRR